VPPGEEGWLKVYHNDGSGWRVLPTTLDTAFNYATAPIQEGGLYALMSNLEIPLYRAGWNLFSYPVQTTRHVSQALQSIDGHYSIVYGYEAADEADPWKVHGVGAPEWVTDLETLAFGRGYWIHVSDAITLYLKGRSGPEAAVASSFPSPPATYYGALRAGGGFTPTAGMAVTAWVGDALCGQAETQVQELDGGMQLAYAVDVLADGMDAAGCGVPGRTASFEVGGQRMATTATWNNDRVSRRDLSLIPIGLHHRVYLPLVAKRSTFTSMPTPGIPASAVAP
jgi:hypothetical protein